MRTELAQDLIEELKLEAQEFIQTDDFKNAENCILLADSLKAYIKFEEQSEE